MVDTERLIDEIRVREYLWNSHAHNYPNKELKRNAWIDIVKSLNPDLVSDEDINDQVTDYTKKWKHIRDYYLRCKYKIKGKSKEPEYFKSLTFLDITKDPNLGKTTRSTHDGNQLGANSSEPNRLKLMPPNQVKTTRSSHEDNQEDSDDPLYSCVYEGEDDNNYGEDSNTTSPSTPEPTPIKQEHGTTTRKRKMTQKSTTRFVSSQECSSNKYFLLSLLTDMDKMDDNQNLDFRLAVLNIIKNIKDASE